MVELKLNFDELVSKLEISSKMPDFTSTLTGCFLSYFKGEGIEFEGFREYVPTDDAKKIDWFASAKTENLLVRELTEEKDLEFFILLDSSYGMFFTSSEKLKCECAAEIVANLSFSMIEANNNVGVGLFNKKIHTFIEAGSGKVHFQKITSKLKSGNLYGGTKNYMKSFSSLVSHIKKKVILIIVSDFLDMEDKDKEYLKLLSAYYQVIGIMIRDKVELELPRHAGVFCVEDINSMSQIIFNSEDVVDDYNNLMREDELKVQSLFLENNCDFFKMYTHEDINSKLIKFFKGGGGT